MPGRLSIRTLELDDPGVPPAEDCVLAHLLRRRAEAEPDSTFIEREDGSAWTYASALADAGRTAAVLRSLGVGPGDRVVSSLPVDLVAVRLLLGCSILGATFVGLNPSYRGAMLRHVVTNSAARVAVVQAAWRDRFVELDLPVALLDPSELEGAAGADEPLRIAPWAPWDTSVIIYTSGTTGPSKGVLSSHVHQHAFATALRGALHAAEDRMMWSSPLFHITGTSTLLSALLYGATLVHVSQFETPRFWSVIRERRVTSAFLVAPQLSFLLHEPVAPADRTHPLRKLVTSPITADTMRFQERFGVEIHTAYSMTEISTPLVAEVNPTVIGSCGGVRPGMEVRLVDAHDIDVPVGEVGELVIRSARPWSLMHGCTAGLRG